MNRLFYIFLLTTLLLLLLYYLVSDALAPYDSNGMLVLQNLLVVSLVIVIDLGLVISMIHILIDKLFFRKFYQNIRIGLGIRRGMIFSTTIVSIFVMKILGYGEIQYLIMIVILGILVEAMIMLLRKKPETDSPQSIDHKADVGVHINSKFSNTTS